MRQIRYTAIVKIVLLLWLIVAAYVLSTGPVFWLAARGFGPPTWVLDVSYSPLQIAKEQSPTIARCMDAYLALWVEFPAVEAGPHP